MLTGLLRENIGYDGVVITDALMMKAVHDKYGHALGAVMALQAGADMPLAQGSLDEQAADRPGDRGRRCRKATCCRPT